MRKVEDKKDVNLQQEMEDAANILDPKVTPQPNWSQLATAFKALHKFISGRSEYSDFNKAYSKGKQAKAAEQATEETEQEEEGNRSWHDEKLLSLLEMFRYSNGPRLAGRLLPNHAARSTKDYADMIYEDLLAGRLVIVDQSLGDEFANRSVAERIVTKLLRSHLETFGEGTPPGAVLVYVEEAHNLLPKKSADGEVNVWARLAKEGAKLNLGLVYATQEVSALQSNILKNTANWFIAHLNNSEEVREISKYYDFEDFAQSIQRTPNKGFIRMRTRSNVFTIPVQMRKFDLATSSAPGSLPTHQVTGGN